MPGPPPPSKSYNLQLDTDSEDDDEQEKEQQRRRQQGQQSISQEAHWRKSFQEASTASSLAQSFQDSSLDDSTAAGCSRSRNATAGKDDDRELAINSFDSISSSSAPNDDDTPNDTPDDVATSTSTAGTGKKKRRRKRKKKKAAAAAPKNVSFSTVEVRQLERTLGGDGVPSDGGGWPLGVTATVVEEEEPLAVQDFESAKQTELHRRWKIHSGHAPPVCIETRQWDYKKDCDSKGNAARNPVFGALTEEQRHSLLTTGNSSSSSSSSKSSSSNNQKSNKGGHGLSPPKGATGMFNRLRSRSLSESENTGPYDPLYVRQVRNELEDLRVARTKEDSTGCTCRKIHVHIPGMSTTTGGKHHKRISMQKVKEELRKRHSLPTLQSTRNKMEQLLHGLVEAEACCSTNECPCVRDGLQCQADACSCWSHGNSKPTTVMEVQDTCGNEYGMYVVNSSRISKFRKDKIAEYCEVIQD